MLKPCYNKDCLFLLNQFEHVLSKPCDGFYIAIFILVLTIKCFISKGTTKNHDVHKQSQAMQKRHESLKKSKGVTISLS